MELRPGSELWVRGQLWTVVELEFREDIIVIERDGTRLQMTAEQAKIFEGETEMAQKLMENGIDPGSAAIQSIISGVMAESRRIMRINSQAGMRSMREVLERGDWLGGGDVDTFWRDDVRMRYALPELDGWVVFYRQPVAELAHIDINPDECDGEMVMHECVADAEAAWAFVDYLTDDEAGKPLAIREDACVVWAIDDHHHWVALTDEPVPPGHSS